MSGDDRVRHCRDCELDVYNISDMTEDEALTFLQNATGRTCISFLQRGDGTIITQECPGRVCGRGPRPAPIAAALLAGSVGIGCSTDHDGQPLSVESAQAAPVPVERRADTRPDSGKLEPMPLGGEPIRLGGKVCFD